MAAAESLNSAGIGSLRYIKLVKITYRYNCRRIDIDKRILQYLLSDLDEQDENDDNEQVIKDADSSDDDVDDLECKLTDVGQMKSQIVIL